MWNTCSNDVNLPEDQALYSVAGYGFEGVKLRTDSSVTLCTDCVQSCMNQMAGQCVGYDWKETDATSSRGECTYYSRIDRAVKRDDRFVAVAKTYTTPSTSEPPVVEPSPAPTLEPEPQTVEPSPSPTKDSHRSFRLGRRAVAGAE